MLLNFKKEGLLANLSCPTSDRNFVINYKGLLANRGLASRGSIVYGLHAPCTKEIKI